jgi:hypothetical protein
MNGGKLLDQIEMVLRSPEDHRVSVKIDIFDSSLGRKWLSALNDLLERDFHLEKNYCFLGFVESQRNGDYILDQVNRSIQAINDAQLGYQINDHFDLSGCLRPGPVGDGQPGRKIVHERLNRLHRYFEDLQGTSGRMSPYAQKADASTKWHIRQLNLLCHEFESWALSYRKRMVAPAWQRPSQLMCWLNAPRFQLESQDHELFGIETLNRPLGGVFVGVNKAVGKHHWEVFQDEGRDSRVGELVTTTLRSQTEAAGDFDIEWGNNPGEYEFQKRSLRDFRHWLTANGFDPDDPALTIGHPQVGQVRLDDSFGASIYSEIWWVLSHHLDVWSIRTSDRRREYDYRWADSDFQQRQVQIIQGERNGMATKNN